MYAERSCWGAHPAGSARLHAMPKHTVESLLLLPAHRQPAGAALRRARLHCLRSPYAPTGSLSHAPPPCSGGLLELFYGVYEKDSDKCLDALVKVGSSLPHACDSVLLDAISQKKSQVSGRAGQGGLMIGISL